MTAIPANPSTAQRSPYIASAVYDWIFFLLPPLFSLLVGALVSGTSFDTDRFWLHGRRVTWTTLLLGIFVHAHLFAVFVRSHLNPDVFPKHRFRFIALPILLVVAMMSSMWAVVIATVLVTFWDVWHSALQTFGLGRIYDRNQGNDPAVGRTWDIVLNLLLYAGPIVSGATMYAHFQKFELFADVDAMLFTLVPVAMKQHQQPIAWAVILGGVLFLLAYVGAYVRFARQGYKVGGQKVFLYVTTGLCSIWAWGFNPFGQAFLIMNLFHALQYFGLVFWSERKILVRRLHLSGRRIAYPLAALIFVSVTLAYGVFAEVIADDHRLLWSMVQTVALMHFFYDGFIWSVRKKQV
ncbi:MAG TPA: hypothetical protein PKA58_01685 [Polyangium sp.]|nr:hypothetical protein [Polyangium sp.]